MKKVYSEPLMEVVEIKTSQQLLAGSQNPTVNSTSSIGIFSTSVSGGSGDARARGFEGDDDDWDF